MTTKLPRREDLTALLEVVRAEPDGPDKATAIEQLEAQLAALEEPGVLTGPDEDLAPPQEVPTGAASVKPMGEPRAPSLPLEDESASDDKPF